MDLTERLESLFERISAKLAELDKITEVDPSNVRAQPASPDELVTLEKATGIDLPNDYKAFMLLHNGWKNFNGESSLLSVQEMLDGPVYEHVVSFQAELRANGVNEVASGWVFEASFGTRLSYFDRTALASGGNLDVVYWHNRELGRFPTFTAYLEDYESTLDQLIIDERENLR
jgi:hypothetical protein